MMKDLTIRSYRGVDFASIQELNAQEGWSNLVSNDEQTKAAFAESNIAYVAMNKDELIGYIRGMTDGHVSMFIAELLVKKEEQGRGIGTLLLKHVHDQYPKTRMDLLGSSTSRTFYEKHGYRSFYGYRITHEEWGAANE